MTADQVTLALTAVVVVVALVVLTVLVVLVALLVQVVQTEHRAVVAVAGEPQAQTRQEIMARLEERTTQPAKPVVLPV
jgi:hypothetical protein